MSPSTDTRAFASELKFQISANDADSLRQWARKRLNADPNGTGDAGDNYLITTVYLDTPAFDVFHRNGSFKRSKYRIRRYCDGEIVFLERKLKSRNLVSKRRSTVDVGELPRVADPGHEKDWPGYWFQRRLAARELSPACQVAYERTARVAMTGNGPIRLTLDQGLRALPPNGFAFQPSVAGVPLNGGACVLELKFRHAMPAMFKQLIMEFGLNPRPFSKYRVAIQSLGFAAPRKAEKREQLVAALA